MYIDCSLLAINLRPMFFSSKYLSFVDFIFFLSISLNALLKSFSNFLQTLNHDLSPSEFLSEFDKVIDEIEPGALRIPVLIKKYVKQNARLVAFNVDPKFNNSVDGLMYIKVSDIPESTVKPVMEEFQAEFERKSASI